MGTHGLQAAHARSGEALESLGWGENQERLALLVEGQKRLTTLLVGGDDGIGII